MTILFTVGGVAAFLTTGGYLFRRKISKNWITKSAITLHKFTKEETTVITGGNTGLGYEVAKVLATCGGKVILACRDNKSGQLAAHHIRESTGNKDVECMALDLASLASVKTFADNLKKRKEKVYGLVCNAGVWIPEDEIDEWKTKTLDGYEMHFGVNHLGHFALIQHMIPYMKQQWEMDSRIVIVSSSLAKMGKIDLKKRDFLHDSRSPDPIAKNSFAPTGYCDSKLMNMLTCRELAVKLQGSNITTYAVSPGFCQSKLGRNVQYPFYKKIFVGPLMRLLQRSTAQGSLNILFATMEEKHKLESGGKSSVGTCQANGIRTRFASFSHVFLLNSCNGIYLHCFQPCIKMGMSGKTV